MSDKSHILVIDDEKNYLLVLQTLLEDEGYTVTAISDPETALAFLAESEVDVVVTDMKMPKVSGREVRVVKRPPRAAAAGAQPMVGRNDPCPCGSGKKYKKCCGRGQF